MGTYVRISKLYIVQICIYLFFRFTEKVHATKTEKSDVATYGGISKLYVIQIPVYLFFRFTDKVCGTKTEQSDVAKYGRRMHINIYSPIRFEQSTVATCGGVSKLYTIEIRFCLLFCFTDKIRGTKTEQSGVATHGGRIHVYTYQYVSNLYILDRNPRLSSYTICVTHSEYISLLLVCGDFPLTLKTGGCWNLLESTPATIPLIKSIHKWTWILFIISNSKLGIWLCSQPRIDLNSQSKFYYVITRPYKYLSNTLYKTTCTEYNLHVIFSV